MKSTIAIYIGVGCIWLCTSCASKKPYYQHPPEHVPTSGTAIPESAINYSLILVGGLPMSQTAPVFRAISESQPAKKMGMVLLGDVVSIDDIGISDEENNQDKSSIIGILHTLDERYKDLFLIPGQKEWSSGKSTTSASLRSLEDALRNTREKGRLIKPSKGCGTPDVIRLSDHTILVLVDSQWAIDIESNSGERLRGCELSNLLEWRQALKDIIQSHPKDHIVIATHHPIYANGPTAGNFPISGHLLPVPVVGTVITGLRTLVSSNQYFGHPAYEAYRAAMISAIGKCKNCVVVSGHEKSLQYYHEDDQHYLVAGSGNEYRHARKGERAGFSYMSMGYVQIDELRNGNLHLSFIAVDQDHHGTPVWETELPLRVEEPKNEDGIHHQNSQTLGDSIISPASDRYGEKKFLRGEFYRKAWSEPVSMPVLWLDSVYGGLHPVQLGGGNQTRSLRMENDEGEQYVIRSIDKKVAGVLPPALRGTFAENIVQDGIAAAHPYGALVIPKLANAAGIFYTIPSVVYVPHQIALGLYDQDVGDGIYLLEERPGGNTRGFSNFGFTEKTVNTGDLLDLITDSHKHVVDQKAVLRARLFDIWLGDWDRHDDQWRWATFEENNLTIYRPIPRDRDQVFFKNDGVLDYLASRPYFNPPLRRFGEKIDFLEGLVWAGKSFDRSFLHELTREDFLAIAKELQTQLSDEVLDEAFYDWPTQIDALDGEEIRRALRVRRDQMLSFAEEFYLHLAKVVTIPGTDDHDVFTVHVEDDHLVSVTVERISGSGAAYRIYHRVFDDRQTNEVRLFGLSKSDSIVMNGEGKSNLLFRVIGGTGKDQLINHSSHLRIIAYDKTNGMILSGHSVRNRMNDRPETNTYDRMDWKLNRSFHFPLPAYYTDEGLGLTYNYWLTQFGFRSDPFQYQHTASLSYYFNTGAFIGHYDAEWHHAIGLLDIGLKAYLTGPTFTQYYYGMGNDYIDYGEKQTYHIVKGSQLILSPALKRHFGYGSALSLTPSYQFIDIEDEHDSPRFIYSQQSGLDQSDFGLRHYLGITAGYHFERLDLESFPSRGAELDLSVGSRSSLGENNIQHVLCSAEGSLYIPFNVTQTVVLATHLGGDKLFGDYEFFHALTLGGPDRLRGYRRDRFAGEARFYHATDLRFMLFKSRGLIPFNLGFYGALDYGRVWYRDEITSGDDPWHVAVGGGIYLVPLGLAAFRLGYMAGDGDAQINIGGAMRF